MKQNNQYRTPLERISEEYRFTLSGVPVITPESDVPGEAGSFPGNVPLAMVYAPESTFTDVYEEGEALEKGTLFSDLFFPFEACGKITQVWGGGVR